MTLSYFLVRYLYFYPNQSWQLCWDITCSAPPTICDPKNTCSAFHNLFKIWKNWMSWRQNINSNLISGNNNSWGRAVSFSDDRVKPVQKWGHKETRILIYLKNHQNNPATWWAREPHLAGGAQTGGRWCLGKEAETLQVRLQISAELHLHWFHPLVHWVHRSSCRTVETEFYCL